MKSAVMGGNDNSVELTDIKKRSCTINTKRKEKEIFQQNDTTSLYVFTTKWVSLSRLFASSSKVYTLLLLWFFKDADHS